MDVMVEMLQRLLQALVQLLLNPFYYVGILFVILQYRRQIRLERKLFSTRLHSLLNETWRALLWGWVGGLLASLAMAFVGATIRPESVFLIWAVSIVLIFFRIRFICLAYGVGALGIIHAIVALVPEAADVSGLGPVFKLLLDLDVPTLLAVVAVLHIVEGLLIHSQGARMASPMFYESKRGKIVGGYQLQGYWPVPLFVIVPMAGGSTLHLPWSTLLNGDAWNSGWTVLSLPFMIGFAELTLSRLPRDKAHLSAAWLVGYGAVVFLLAVAAHFWEPATFAAALLTIALHEALIWYSNWSEGKQPPFYVHNEKGLKILAVLPSGAAAELGLQPGEILHKVNGVRIFSRADLHQALQLNSAFCKLEVLNLQGEVRFLQRALFAGDHHLLGLILSPDEEALYYVETKQTHIIAHLRKKLIGLLNSSGKPM